MKKTTADGMLAGLEAGNKQSATDARLAADALQAQDVGLVALDAIEGRAGGLDTRQPTPEDLEALEQSLDALGLLEPLVLDNKGRLLAGKTRLMALRRLKAKDPDRWQKVPVRRMPFDAEAEPARALAVEVAENEHRRDYTAAEIKALAERLKTAGLDGKPGRPRKGSRALLPALGAVVGKSKRQLLRILAPEPAPPETVPHVTFNAAAQGLRRPLEKLLAVACPRTAAARLVWDAAADLKAALAALEPMKGI